MITPTTESTLRMTLMQLSETRLELAAAREEITLLKTNLKIQTNHTENAVQDRADEHIELHNQIHELREQRDRLAEWLKWIAGWNHQLFDENTAMQMRDKAEQALQSLNPDHTVAANDMIAAVKRGADE